MYLKNKTTKKGKRKNRFPAVIVLTICFWFPTACSDLSTSLTRKQVLQEALQFFHMTLISQNRPDLVRFIPAEEKQSWDSSFACLFQKIRLIDYHVEKIDVLNDSKEAKIIVKIVSHPLNALVTKEILLEENWSYIDQHWYFVSSIKDFKILPEECLSP